MSYSFKVHAPTRAAALKEIEAQLDKVVAQQPVHAADQKSAFWAASEFLEAVPVPEGRELDVSLHGSVTTVEGEVRSANFGISILLVPAAQEG